MSDIIGIDHIYITVSNLEQSERFYDTVMNILGFKKNTFQFDNEQHIQYYNRHFGYVLRPARVQNQHNPYAPGIHHLCLRMENEKQVDQVAKLLQQHNISVSTPRLYPEYAADYFAIYFNDPDGIQLEITNYRQERRQRHDDWENIKP